MKRKFDWFNIVIIGIAFTPVIAIGTAIYIFLHFLIKFW